MPVVCAGRGTTLTARLHDCRHAYATHMLAAGLTAHAVAALLGHSDAGLVLRRYGHALPAEVAGAGAVLSAWRAAEAGRLAREVKPLVEKAVAGAAERNEV